MERCAAKKTIRLAPISVAFCTISSGFSLVLGSPQAKITSTGNSASVPRSLCSSMVAGFRLTEPGQVDFLIIKRNFQLIILLRAQNVNQMMGNVFW
jgi:hypothetical protein